MTLGIVTFSETSFSQTHYESSLIAQHAMSLDVPLEKGLLVTRNNLSIVSPGHMRPGTKIVLVYPITYRTMCGTAKSWLEHYGNYFIGTSVMAIGVAGSPRGTHTFEQDFISVMSGIGAKWYRNNVLVVPGSEEDRKRARHHVELFMKEES